jgi:hypothetical protein
MSGNGTPVYGPRDARTVERAVSSWLGNPISRGALTLACTSGRNGIRLDYGLRRYAGLENGRSDFLDEVSG